MAASEDGKSFVEHPLLVGGTIEAREYQLELAADASVDHTLICLPTGLGKTAVSALVSADRLADPPADVDRPRILLLAPTKPLVEQHAEDFRQWFDIPTEEIVVFTGEVRPADRQALWEDATIVVATPQVIENDLVGGRISLRDVVHCTFDECHRATGEYAYTYIADRYHADGADPLVTGMSASPGDDTAAIKRVCSNLGISRVEVRTADDADVAPYTHDTTVEWQRITLPEEVLDIRNTLNDVIEDRLEQLSELGIRTPGGPDLSEDDLQRLRGRLQELIDDGDANGYQGMSLHAEIRKLKTAVTYVETQSVEALRRYFERQRNAARSSGASKASQRFVSDPRVKRAMRLARAYDDLHPKFRRTRMLLAETLGIEGGDRVIVFTESRDTAEALTEFLGDHFSTAKFVGQSDTEGSEGMTQREQRDTLEAFRGGDYDVLVSTSVAEEGLDVPEVDLVLFYEPVPTAIRSIQRKGRTGRQREGRVVVLLAEDTRDEAYYWIAQRREDEMREQLAELAGVADDLTAELGGIGDRSGPDAPNAQRDGGQAGLESFGGDQPDGASDDGPSVEIVVDQRELDSPIAKDLSKRADVAVELGTLDVGDYVLSDRVAVERKTVTDFLDSLLGGDDRSLFEQVGDLARNYPRPVVILEGEGLYEERNVHPNAIRGAVASLSVDFGASLLWTADAEETAALLETIARREQTAGDRTVSAHGEKAAKTLAEQQEYVVSSIADVGPVTARSLLAELGSVEAVMTADEESLRDVEGVGEKTAARIREIVGAEYEP